MVSQPPTRYKVSARYQNRAHFWEIGGDVSMDKWGENMGFWWADNGIPSGKRLHSELENHHAIHRKIHYFDWAIFNSFLHVITRGYHQEDDMDPLQKPWWATTGPEHKGQTGQTAIGSAGPTFAQAGIVMAREIARAFIRFFSSGIKWFFKVADTAKSTCKHRCLFCSAVFWVFFLSTTFQ